MLFRVPCMSAKTGDSYDVFDVASPGVVLRGCASARLALVACSLKQSCDYISKVTSCVENGYQHPHSA